MDGVKETIVARFLKENILLAANSLQKIVDANADVDDIIEAAKAEGVWFVADDFLSRFLIKEEEIAEAAEDIAEPEASGVRVERSRNVYAKDIEPQLKIIESSDVTNKSTSQATLESFVEYFNVKYGNLASILRERVNFRSAIPISSLKKAGGLDRSAIRIICMVSEKRDSKSGNRFLEVEDPTGQATVMLPKDKPHLLQEYDNVLLDSVVGIEGVLHNDMLIATEITNPDLPLTKEIKLSEEEVYAAFMSDIHIGSYLFLEREFDRFIRWINLKADNQDIAEKVKYLFVAGDLVDGIGIYPTQERELVIPDIYKQYDFLAALIEQIPDYIEIVMSMGNHDATRNAEPQPSVSKDIAARLYDMPNVHVVGNPVRVETHGVQTLIYHGTSLDTIIGNLANCSYRSPENAMIEYLKRRHLAPMYGNDVISPESVDYMSILEVPDILHCGHVHTNGYAVYRGVKVINSGTWQGKTKYQEQLGHVPTPARLPVMNLSNQEVKVLHFGD